MIYFIWALLIFAQAVLMGAAIRHEEPKYIITFGLSNALLLGGIVLTTQLL